MSKSKQTLHNIFPRYYGKIPSISMIEFCGEEVIDELMKLPFERRGVPTYQKHVNFTKRNRKFFIMKLRKDGCEELCFHVYERRSKKIEE